MSKIKDCDRSLENVTEILELARNLKCSIQVEEKYVLTEENYDDNEEGYLAEDGDDGDKWIRLNFEELLNTVKLLNTVVAGDEPNFPPEAIVQLAVHHYKIADSLHTALKCIFDSFASVEEKVANYMLEHYPEEWEQYEKQCDAYDQIELDD